MQQQQQRDLLLPPIVASSQMTGYVVPNLSVQIMLEDKPLVWQDLKQKYLKDPHQYTRAIIQANTLRKGIVNALLAQVITSVDPTNATTYRADGSTDLTSDYDVTMSGARKEAVTILFNEVFETMFGGVPSAEVFDTNVYGSGPLATVDGGIGEIECKGHFTCSSACVAQQQDAKNSGVVGSTTPKNKTDRCVLISQLRHRFSSAVVANQHAWALATILRNITPLEQEWLTTEILQVTQTPTRLQRLYRKAIEFYKANPLIDDIRAANAKYGEVLEDIYKLRIAGEANENNVSASKAFALQYANAESRGGWYAQEAYVTMGPFLHVVGNDQRKLDLGLSADEYKDSFIENMAYVLHALVSTSTCSQSFVIAAKYITRAAFAATQVFETTEDEIVDELKLLMQESSKVRAQRESLLTRANANEHVENDMIKHMKGVGCVYSGSSNKDDGGNASARKQVLQWILSYLFLMF